MKYKNILLRLSFLSFVAILFSSCSAAMESVSPTVAFIGFAVLFVFLLFLLFYIFWKRNRIKKSQLSVNSFNAKIKTILTKLDTNEEKIETLKYTLKQLESHEEYDKNMTWKNSLLVTVYSHMEKIYYNMGDEQKVIEVCTEIIELEPNHAMTYYNRGSLYSNAGEYQKALDDLTLSAEINSSYPYVYNNRGLVYYKMKRYTEAIEDYTYAIKLGGLAIAYYNRGNAFSGEADFQKALADYEKYIELDPDDEVGMRKEVQTLIDKLKS